MVIYMERSSIFEWVNQLLIGGLEHEFYDFPYIGKVIIPTDELYHFSEEKSQHVGKKHSLGWFTVKFTGNPIFNGKNHGFL